MGQCTDNVGLCGAQKILGWTLRLHQWVFTMERSSACILTTSALILGSLTISLVEFIFRRLGMHPFKVIFCRQQLRPATTQMMSQNKEADVPYRSAVTTIVSSLCLDAVTFLP